MSTQVPFTYYKRPNGQRIDGYAEVDQATADKAAVIIHAGFHFEAETLMTGQVSLTIGDDNGDYAYEIYPESEDGAPHVIALINKTSIDDLQKAADAAKAGEED